MEQADSTQISKFLRVVEAQIPSLDSWFDFDWFGEKGRIPGGFCWVFGGWLVFVGLFVFF